MKRVSELTLIQNIYEYCSCLRNISLLTDIHEKKKMKKNESKKEILVTEYYSLFLYKDETVIKRDIIISIFYYIIVYSRRYIYIYNNYKHRKIKINE